MISVIICTRNRAAALERCLLHMSQISPAGFVWQLVVVDNGSEDCTRAVTERFASSLPLDYVFEPKPGLSLARNTGIVASRYPIVAFTDDDCLVDADWLRAIVNAFTGDAELAALGGPVERWDGADHDVGTRGHRAEEQIGGAERIVSLMIGCNMAFRREVFDTVGLFDPGLGKGTAIGSGEDIDLLYRVLKQNRKVVYRPDMVVYHAHGRRSRDSTETVRREYLRGRGAFYWKFIADPGIFRMAYWEVSGLVKDCVRIPAPRDSLRILRHLAAGALRKLLDDLTMNSARRTYRSSN